MSFTLYVASSSNGDEPPRLIFNARSFGIPLTQLQNVIDLLNRFQKRGGYDAENQIYAVARFDDGRQDEELMLIFGWGADGGWWIPFFKITAKKATDMHITQLRELVTRKSLEAVGRTKVAIGCG